MYLKIGYTCFTLFVHLSIHPPIHLSMDGIVFTLYLQQYLMDLFLIYTSYQITSEGLLHVKVFAKFRMVNCWQTFKICNVDCLVLTFDPIWINSMGNYGVVGGIFRMQVFHFLEFEYLFYSVSGNLSMSRLLPTNPGSWVWTAGYLSAHWARGVHINGGWEHMCLSSHPHKNPGVLVVVLDLIVRKSCFITARNCHISWWLLLKGNHGATAYCGYIHQTY